ncbi:MAG: hypothetical protein ACRDNK_21770 [Solirubrobacteraceae bacterium]
MTEPESPPPRTDGETGPTRGAGLRLFAAAIALAAGTGALVVAIVLIKGVLS